MTTSWLKLWEREARWVRENISSQRLRIDQFWGNALMSLHPGLAWETIGEFYASDRQLAVSVWKRANLNRQNVFSCCKVVLNGWNLFGEALRTTDVHYYFTPAQAKLSIQRTWLGLAATNDIDNLRCYAFTMLYFYHLYERQNAFFRISVHGRGEEGQYHYIVRVIGLDNLVNLVKGHTLKLGEHTRLVIGDIAADARDNMLNVETFYRVAAMYNVSFWENELGSSTNLALLASNGFAGEFEFPAK